jgi:high frequency lysogenization protein
MSQRADRALALAGVFQAAALVHRVAWHGPERGPAVEASLASLFEFDTATTVAVYGGIPGIRRGLQAMVEQLSGEASPTDAPVMVYALGLLHLERRADARSGLWDRMHQGLVAAGRQREAFGLDHPNTLAALAALYADLVSPVGPRIMVEGEPTHLRNPDTASLIRALLLAGTRSAVLWRQLGASRWSLLFRRRRLVDDAEAWLTSD